jgi:hypothetical protein
MVGDPAKEYLHSDLREVREVLLWRVEGRTEYNARRPLTSTGTNLPGLRRSSRSISMRPATCPGGRGRT